MRAWALSVVVAVLALGGCASAPAPRYEMHEVHFPGADLKKALGGPGDSDKLTMLLDTSTGQLYYLSAVGLGGGSVFGEWVPFASFKDQRK